jgi:hypothetical protein
MSKLQSFFINWYGREPTRYYWKEVLGYGVDIDLDTGIAGFELFAFENQWGEWQVSDVLTGSSVSKLSLDFEKKKDAICNAQERLATLMNAGKLQESFDKQVNYLRKCGLLDEQNNKIGEKIMIEKEVSEEERTD